MSSRIILFALTLLVFAPGQSPGQAVSAQPAAREDKFFDFWLMVLDHYAPYATLTKRFEDSIITTYKLNAQETATFRSMAQEARAEFKTIRQSVAQLTAAGTRSPEANSQLAAAAQRKLAYVNRFGTRFLGMLRPEVAASVRNAMPNGNGGK